MVQNQGLSKFRESEVMWRQLLMKAIKMKSCYLQQQEWT